MNNLTSQNNAAREAGQTIADRITAIRAKHGMNRTQLFVEGRELILQGVKLTNGATGCTWKAERGDTLHTALDEAEQLLAEAQHLTHCITRRAR